MPQSTAFGGALRARRGTAFRSVLLCGIVLSGCGDPEPKEPGSGEAPVVRGGERLVFDQSAPSSSELARYQFALYVDGNRSTFANVRCDNQRVGDNFQCSGVLPSLSRGTHTLQLTTLVDGRESSRSGQLVVTSLGQEGLALQAAPAAAGRTPTASDASLCWTASDASCFRVSALFSTNEQITSLAITDDGRVMFVENGQRVRVLAGNVLRSESAFQVERATDRIVDIALDPHFADTGTVYVAWVEEAVPNSRTLTISRFREVQSVLGEGIVIMSDVPVPDGGNPHIAVDAQRRVYVALPQSRETQQASGLVLRLTDEGTVPWDSGQRSPTLMSGLGVPTAIASDPSNGRLWVAGQRDDRSELMWLLTDQPSSDRGPRRGVMDASSGVLASLTVLPDTNGSRSARLIGIDSTGRLLSAGIDRASVPPQPLRVVDFPYGVPLEIATGSRQELYVLSKSSPESRMTIFVLEQAPQ